MLIGDPYFYLTAIPAVLIYGMAKGGLGSAAGALAVPLMALTTEPLTAAAILLPIIFLMDIHVVKLFWNSFDRDSLRVIVPAALIGVLIGSLLLGTLPVNGLRLFVGVIAIVFCIDYWVRLRQAATRAPPGAWSGRFWAVVAGITSTHIHAGGPAISVYLLPLNLDKVVLVGTFGVFFFVLNFVKLIPYSLLGQFDARNLLTALVLLPFAPIGIRLGYAFLERVPQATIYHVIYVLLFLTGIKLLFDGLALAA